MPRKAKGLSALDVTRLKRPGVYADGGGLYLRIDPDRRSWLLRFTVAGKRRTMGLGPCPDVSLAEARKRAAEARESLRSGVDPIAARQAQRSAIAAATATAITFEQAAGRYIKAHSAGWRNAKHAAQWGSTLATYAYPVFGKVAVAAVDTGMVVKVLEPIWSEKPETASRVRGRIEAVLDWARVREYRTGDNPARWRGHLDQIFPRKEKVRAVRHHNALPYAEVGAFLALLRQQEGVAALAMELAILTACRTGEIIGATWAEFDLAGKMWTIPANRMKRGPEHRVPLSDAALAVLAKAAAIREGDHVFPGGRAGRPISNMAMLTLLRRMGRMDITVHGFRSAFKTWGAEQTPFQNEVIEKSMSHAIRSKVEAAYQRGDLMDKRRRLMADWAAYCTGGHPDLP